jgi:hypothetical protein
VIFGFARLATRSQPTLRAGTVPVQAAPAGRIIGRSDHCPRGAVSRGPQPPGSTSPCGENRLEALLMSSRITAIVFSSICVTLAGAAYAAPAPLTVSSLEGADFDFVISNVDKDHAYIKYGAVKLLAGGKSDVAMWIGDERESVPAQANVGQYSPTVEIPAGPAYHDGGVKITSHPAAFRGKPQQLSGRWWAQDDGYCVQFDEPFALFVKAIPASAEKQWGRIFTNKSGGTKCGPSGQPGVSSAAPESVVVALSERVYDRNNLRILVKYQPFQGLITRLNGWMTTCEVFKWNETMLNFKSDLFGPAGKDAWRSVTLEPHKGAPDMPIFSYLAISQQPVPAIGRIMLMDVGHDFNRNGRIDDDWGHIYAGFPILSADGELGGLLMFDYSPVGLREIGYPNGCRTSAGPQLTHTLGLILYTAPRWQSLK